MPPEQSKKWRLKNPDRVKAYRRAYYRRNLEQQRQRGRDYGKTPRARFTNGRVMAKKRNLEWDITQEEHASLLQSPCYYCNGPLNKSGHGLDRKNNSIGYRIDNVVPCCNICNSSKGEHFTSEEFFVMIKALVEYRKQK